MEHVAFSDWRRRFGYDLAEISNPDYKCQGYGHVVANCPSPVRVSIDKLLVVDLVSDSEEFIYQAEELEDSDSGEKIRKR